MKKILLILLVFSAVKINAQWVQTYSGAGSNALYGIYFTSPDAGWIVGKGGTVKKSTDGGVSWVNKNINLDIELNDLYFINENTGIIFGEKCSAYKTTNGGTNWNLKFSDTTSPQLYFIANQFLNSMTGYAVGNRIIKTTNGGETWTNQSFPVAPGKGFRSVSFINDQTGWTVGYVSSALQGVTLKTTNGGVNWIQQSGIDSVSLQYVKFFTSATGIIAGTINGFSKFYKTTNSGTSWNLLSTITGSITAGSFFLDENTGLTVISSPHRIFKTINGGINWNYQTFNQSLWSIFFSNNDLGWIVGGGFPQEYVLKTTNGGNVFINNNSNEISSNFNLSQNYPNPFNPSTIINYQLTINSFVTLNIYDVNGRLVKELVNEKQSAESYEVNFDGSGLPSGTYVYRLQAGDFSETKKMMLLK